MTKSGVSIDKEALAAFFKALDGKTVTGACKAGAKKLVAMPSGGGRAAPAGGAAGAGAAAIDGDRALPALAGLAGLPLRGSDLPRLRAAVAPTGRWAGYDSQL